MKNKSMSALLTILDHSKMTAKEKTACHKLTLDLAFEKYQEGMNKATEIMNEQLKQTNDVSTKK